MKRLRFILQYDPDNMTKFYECSRIQDFFLALDKLEIVTIVNISLADEVLYVYIE